MAIAVVFEPCSVVAVGHLALVEGMIEGAGADATATLAPEEGYCCVRIAPAV